MNGVTDNKIAMHAAMRVDCGNMHALAHDDPAAMRADCVQNIHALAHDNPWNLMHARGTIALYGPNVASPVEVCSTQSSFFRILVLKTPYFFHIKLDQDVL